jgi:hypothetical protein
LKTQAKNKISILYPTSSHFEEAVNSEWERIQALDRTINHPFTFCISYYDYDAVKAQLKDVHLVYSSMKDNAVCLWSLMSMEKLERYPDLALRLHFLYPVPPAFKLDISALSVLEHTHSLESHGCEGDVTLESQLRCHPIRQHVESQQPLYKSIEFTPNNMVRNLAEYVSEWKTSFLDPMKRSSALFPRKEISRQNFEGNPLPLNIPSHYSDSLTRRNELIDVWDQLSTMQLNHNPNGHDAAACNWEELEKSIIYRNKNILIRIPNSYYQRDHPHSDNACLARFLQIVTESVHVVLVGISPPLRMLNNFARPITQSGGITSAGSIYYDAGLTGLGMIVGIADTGVDQDSCFFRDTVNGFVPVSSADNPVAHLKYRKVVQYVNYSGSSGDWSDGHGSHVSGTVAGQCIETSNANKIYDGMAPAAKIAMFDIGEIQVNALLVPADMATIYSATKSAGGKVHSNSWGGSYWYDSFSIETDIYAYANDDMVLVYAAGNSGTAGVETVLSPSLGKNVISVAAGYARDGGKINHLASFSSIGPAPDGRIKPDITAPGNSIKSAESKSENDDKNSCSVVPKSGTSMAAPVVAGNVALIQQYFVDQAFWATICNADYPKCADGAFQPKGSLIKALVLHSGSQMAMYEGGGFVGHVDLDHTPDFYQGYGRLDLKNILPLPDQSPQFDLFVDTVNMTSFTEILYRVQLDTLNMPLKVTISWYDPPVEVFASKVLVHDIDVIVENPRGEKFFGNTPSLNTTNGVNPPIGDYRDEVNNNEQIVIASPRLTGVYTIHIQAKQLFTSGHQLVSVVITSSGSVTGDGLQQTLHSLDPSLLDECSINDRGEIFPSTEPLSNIGVSLWSLAARNAWDKSTFYSIAPSDLDDDNTYNYLASWGDDSVQRMYRYDSLCIPEGCYDVRLMLSEKSTHLGTQLSIPGCDIYLAPLLQWLSFCVTHRMVGGVPEPKTATLGGVGICLSECQSKYHYDLPVLLYEDYGEGWRGGYYAIIEMSDDPYTGDLVDYSIGGGSLEFGFVDEQYACIPASNQDYYLVLSYPEFGSIEDYNPQVGFPTAISLADRSNCTFTLDRETPMATITVDADLNYAIIKFYSRGQTLPYEKENFGQGYSTWDELLLMFASNFTIYQATCVVELDLIVPLSEDYGDTNPTARPTGATITTSPPTAGPVMPTLQPVSPTSSPTNPTAHPTGAPIAFSPPTAGPVMPTLQPVSPTSSPTNPTAHPTGAPIAFSPPTAGSVMPTLQPVSPTSSPTVLKVTGFNFSCFSSCPAYSALDFPAYQPANYELPQTACSYIMEFIYKDCTSYNLGHGRCVMPSCATSCDLPTWCYFGSASLISCSDSPAFVFEGLYQQCMSAYDSNDLNQSQDSSSTVETASSSNRSTETALFGKLFSLYTFSSSSSRWLLICVRFDAGVDNLLHLGSLAILC